MNLLLSLIIPVYKAEKFIEACLGSVFGQMPERVEVILVDDGSPDSSMDVVRRSFSEQIERGLLVLLGQSNMGPGAARNAGIGKARGKYIGFLDSDDVLLNGYFSQVFSHLESGIVDVVEFGFKRFTKQGNLANEAYRPLYGFSGQYRLSEVRNQVFAAGCWFPSTRVYRREIFGRFRFPEGTHYEDLMLLPSIYKLDLIVYFIDRPLLGYRYNPASITSRHTERQLNEMYGFYQSIPLNTACDATKILKLKTARGVVFFHSELNIQGFPIDKLIEEIRKMQLDPGVLSQLRFPDWLFFHFPAIYAHIDKIRVPTRKRLLRLSSTNSGGCGN